MYTVLNWLALQTIAVDKILGAFIMEQHWDRIREMLRKLVAIPLVFQIYILISLSFRKLFNVFPCGFVQLTEGVRVYFMCKDIFFWTRAICSYLINRSGGFLVKTFNFHFQFQITLVALNLFSYSRESVVSSRQ